jgi:hypothetical protein
LWGIKPSKFDKKYYREKNICFYGKLLLAAFCESWVKPETYFLWAFSPWTND